MRVLTLLLFSVAASAQLTPHTLTVSPSQKISLNVRAPFDISVAATGLKRPRFFAQSPDGRIFVTTMYNLTDNTRGTVEILDGWDPASHTFRHITPYLTGLRNPNNLAFYTDAAHQTWLYLPLTDKLIRYKYTAGDTHPTSAPQVLMRFPDYGLNYKYGGWHLTRTVAIATLHGTTRVFVSAGSSCNYCMEREAQRASLIAMDPDGKNPQIVAHGLRNAVDLRYVPDLDGGALFATNMGDDHLGDQLPEDTFFELDANTRRGTIAGAANDAPNYGWPACYFAAGKPVLDHTPLPVNPGPDDPLDDAPKPPTSKSADSVYGVQKNSAAAGTNLGAQIINTKDLPELGPVPAPLTTCAHVPAAYTTFAAHSSPLGFAYIGQPDHFNLTHTFLIALHGSGHQRVGTGYKVITLSADTHEQRDFLTGFMTHEGGTPHVHGRPCGILQVSPDEFLITDDKLGVIYYIAAKH